MDNAEALRALEILADMAHMEAEEYAKAGGGGRVESLHAALRAHLTDPGYVRVPVEPTNAIVQVYDDYKSLRYNPANASEQYYAKHLHAAMLAAATGERHD